MDTTQAQIRLSLSHRLNDLLKSRAERLGLPLTQFVKHLLVKEVEKDEYPVFPASARTEKRAKEAMKNIDKSEQIDNISDFFKAL